MPLSKIEQSSVNSGVAGTGPAFSAVSAGGQVISSGTYTKIQFTSEEFDTNNNFDTSTYRFTPTVAGYYQCSGAMGFYTPGTVTPNILVFYKNGSAYKNGAYLNTNPNGGVVNGSILVYLNGSTDYMELYGYVASTGTITIQANPQTYFQASLVRAA